jgi:hypothetical protein
LIIRVFLLYQKMVKPLMGNAYLKECLSAGI